MDAPDLPKRRGGQAADRDGQVVVLAGGTGGAKLARGMLDVVGHERLTVIANTGDDIEIYGAHVSPDPDLVSFWLADLIDDRGWGLRGDTFTVMDALRKLGVEVWFNLGDRDLAWCIERSRMLSEGKRPTQALRALCERIGVDASVLPMSDQAQRTFVNGVSLQEFMIKRRGQGPVDDVRFEAPQQVSVTREVREALQSATAVIVGPSNPVISIWPILRAIGEALRQTTAPVVLVSPVVGGEIVKGPTAAFLDAYRHPVSAAGVLAFYDSRSPGLIDGVVADERLQDAMPSLCTMPSLCIDTRMDDPAARALVARRTLLFAESLRAQRGEQLSDRPDPDASAS